VYSGYVNPGLSSTIERQNVCVLYVRNVYALELIQLRKVLVVYKNLTISCVFEKSNTNNDSVVRRNRLVSGEGTINGAASVDGLTL
jgi:hypothetical protein